MQENSKLKNTIERKLHNGIIKKKIKKIKNENSEHDK